MRFVLYGGGDQGLMEVQIRTAPKKTFRIKSKFESFISLVDRSGKSAESLIKLRSLK